MRTGMADRPEGELSPRAIRDGRFPRRRRASVLARIGLALLLVGAGGAPGCAQSLPEPIRLDGFPPALESGAVLAVDQQPNALELLLEGSEQRPLRIAPWPPAMGGLTCASCRFVLRRAFLPDGPLWRFEVRDGDTLMLVVGKNTRANQVLLPGVRLKFAAGAAPPRESPGQPPRLVLDGPSGEQEVRLGQPVGVTLGSETWMFVLIGATPGPSTPQASRPPDSPSAGPPLGRIEIADEQPALVADWVLVRKAAQR